MVSERRGRSPEQGGPTRHRHHDRMGDRHGGRLVPYQPKRIKGNINKRCYVNNLPYDCRWQQFKDHMKSAGNVTFVELFEDGTGKSMGCGLVEFSTPEEAKKAIDSLNDSKLNGREIKVKSDEIRFYPKVPDLSAGAMGPPGGPMGPMDMGPPMGGMGGMGMPHMGGNMPGQLAVSNVVFVSNLVYEITPKFLRDTFKAAGEILKVNLERDRDGKSKGFGTVVFGNPDMAMYSIDMFNGRMIKGRKMSVRLDRLTAVNVPSGPPMGGMGPMGPMGGMGPMGPGPMGPGPMQMGHHGPMGPGPMGPGPMGPGPMGPGPMDGPPMGGQMGPGPMGPGSMGPGPMNSSNMGPGMGGHTSQQQQLLQSIGLAAISSMLQGGQSPMSGMMGAAGGGGDGRGPSGGSALENLLGRDALEGLLRTQNVGSSAAPSPYQQDTRPVPEHHDYIRERDDRRPEQFSDHRESSSRHSDDRDRYANKYRSESSSKSKIFVRNIPFTLSNQQLRDFFRHAGHIVDCNIMVDNKGQSRGCATVKFESGSDAERAVNMFHRSHLQGREIEVRVDN